MEPVRERPRGQRSFGRGRWDERGRGPRPHALLRRQGGDGRTQRRRQDEHPQGPGGGDACRGRHGEAPRRRGISPSGSTPASGRRRDERHRVSPRRSRARRPATGGGEGAPPARGTRVGGARGSLRAARGGVRTKRRVSRRGGRASDRRGAGSVPGPADPPRRARSRAANGDGSSWLGSCSAGPICCCWTNRRTTSMRTPRAG